MRPRLVVLVLVVVGATARCEKMLDGRHRVKDITSRSRSEAARMTQHLLPTTVVGSYPQPDWLVDRALLHSGVPRVRMHELWRVSEPYLAQAQDDATLIAIRDMERARIDLITDREMPRESYSHRVGTAPEAASHGPPATI